ncbi:hypothetical protein LCGC14_1177130 [marine sediment metagenome]|uniref:4Fe-4S ferredoxin-type domain-containing protein n=1 Tax=marine sediment metagenome TaxID=412755 RepID=A0A0F9LNA3_9ZZZZ
MGSLDWEVSVLGFGAMRLPMIDQTAVNEEEAIKMLRYAIDNGVNYIDTAYPYHYGESEVLVGKALQDGYREKVHLTTKLPMWEVRKSEDFNRFLQEQINRLQTKPDIYLFHGLTNDGLKKIKKLSLIDKMEEVREEGLFRYIGFSFHDNFEVFKEIIDYYCWDCCQIQFNYLDVEYQAGIKGVEYAGSKNIALIIMEPIRGGKLAISEDELESRPEIKQILEKAPIKRTMADWALQFVWDHPEVSVVLSGMSSMQQVKENIESANNSASNSLSAEDLRIISELREVFDKYNLVPCTSCRYCRPCPQGVAIPWILRIINELAYWGEQRREKILSLYNKLAKTPAEVEKRLSVEKKVDGEASLCIQCGECLEKCPQQIDIPDMIKKAAEIFEEGKKISEVFP